MRTSVVIVLQVWIAVGFPQTSEVRGDDSLHAVIDQHLRPVSGLVPARCADAELLIPRPDSSRDLDPGQPRSNSIPTRPLSGAPLVVSGVFSRRHRRP